MRLPNNAEKLDSLNKAGGKWWIVKQNLVNKLWEYDIFVEIWYIWRIFVKIFSLDWSIFFNFNLLKAFN